MRALLAGVAAAVVLAGCSASAGSPGGDLTGAVQPTTTKSSSAEGPGSVHSGSILSEEQAARLRVEALRERAASLGIEGYEPPELVRWINILDYPTVGAQCLTEAGFPSVAENGVVHSKGMAQAQAQAWQMARLDCDARYSVHPYYSLPPSPAAAGKLYDWLIGTAVPCLERHGLSVKAAPTRETYVSMPLESRWFPWDAELQEQIAQRFDEREAKDRLDRECPMNPGLTVFNEHDPVPRSS